MGKQLKQSNQGFSLMEVLIAIIVIAIGLLGFLSLQLASINSNQEGMARSQANLVAQDLAASMRANRHYIFNGDAGEADTAKGNAYVGDIYDNCVNAATKVCTGATSCTDKEQAVFDVWMTCRTIKGFEVGVARNDLLNEGEVFVSCDDRDGTDADTCSPGSTLTIYTYWLADSLREDVGQSTTVIRNSRCDSANFASDPGTNYNCIVMDIMP